MPVQEGGGKYNIEESQACNSRLYIVTVFLECQYHTMSCNITHQHSDNNLCYKYSTKWWYLNCSWSVGCHHCIAQYSTAVVLQHSILLSPNENNIKTD